MAGDFMECGVPYGYPDEKGAETRDPKPNQPQPIWLMGLT